MRQRAGAERRPHGNLSLSRQRSGQLKIRDVRARDEQDERHRGRQHQERQTHAPDRLFLERQHTEREPAVRRVEVGVLAAQPRRQRIELGSRARDRRTWFQRRDDVVVLAIANLSRIGRERQRQDHFGVIDDAERGHDFARQRERRRQHADDLVRLAVERQRAADDVAIPAVAAHPRAEPEQRLARLAGSVVVGSEEIAEERTHAEHRQQVRRDADGPDAFGLAVARQVGIGANRDRDVLEALRTVLDIEVLRRRKPVFGDPEAGRRVPENDLPIRVLVRQRPQQERARDAEDRGVRTNPNRQREYGDDRESWRGEEGANRVAEVLRERAHAGQLTSRSVKACRVETAPAARQISRSRISTGTCRRRFWMALNQPRDISQYPLALAAATGRIQSCPDLPLQYVLEPRHRQLDAQDIPHRRAWDECVISRVELDLHSQIGPGE